MRQKEAEFSRETKRAAYEKAGNKCERCGSTRRLEAHHIISLWFAKEVPSLSIAVISHLANVEILCYDCHTEDHRQESRKRYAELAPQVLSRYLAATIKPEKDDWRKQLIRRYDQGNPIHQGR